MIKALLVDDEADALEMLDWQLKQYCPQVQITAQCNSVKEAVRVTNELKPDLVFLDIEMPHQNGFDFIKTFPQPSFDIIFTTAYNQFALQAFKAAALDYLLKPIDSDDLIKSVNRFEKKQQHNDLKLQLEKLMAEYKQPKSPVQRIALPTADGIVLADPEEIVRAEASNNYTSIHFNDGKKMVLAKTLKDIEFLLQSYSFIRIHQSHVVNIGFISKYSKNDGGFIIMKDGVRLPVSRQRKEELLRLISHSE